MAGAHVIRGAHLNALSPLAYTRALTPPGKVQQRRLRFTNFHENQSFPPHYLPSLSQSVILSSNRKIGRKGVSSPRSFATKGLRRKRAWNYGLTPAAPYPCPRKTLRSGTSYFPYPAMERKGAKHASVLSSPEWWVLTTECSLLSPIRFTLDIYCLL